VRVRPKSSPTMDAFQWKPSVGKLVYECVQYLMTNGHMFGIEDNYGSGVSLVVREVGDDGEDLLVYENDWFVVEPTGFKAYTTAEFYQIYEENT
jgi:CYTH domain-containing protein